MKRLKTMALVLAAFTAFIVFAGFRSGRPSATPANEPASEEVKDNRPFAVRCLAVIDDKIQVVAIATGCTPMDNSTCVLTTCPDKAPDKSMKVVLFRCIDATGKTIAVANGCVTATDSYCTPSSCPPGTSATTK